MARPFIGIARRGTKCRSKTTLSEPFACPFLAHVAPTALSEVSFGCLINYWAIVDWWPVAQRRRPPRVSLPSSVSIDDISDMLVRGEGEGGRGRQTERWQKERKKGERGRERHWNGMQHSMEAAAALRNTEIAPPPPPICRRRGADMGKRLARTHARTRPALPCRCDALAASRVSFQSWVTASIFCREMQ